MLLVVLAKQNFKYLENVMRNSVIPDMLGSYVTIGTVKYVGCLIEWHCSNMYQTITLDVSTEVLLNRYAESDVQSNLSKTTIKMKHY